MAEWHLFLIPNPPALRSLMSTAHLQPLYMGRRNKVRVPVAPMTWSEGQGTKQGFPFFPTRSVSIGWKIVAKGPDHQTRALLAPPLP